MPMETQDQHQAENTGQCSQARFDRRAIEKKYVALFARLRSKLAAFRREWDTLAVSTLRSGKRSAMRNRAAGMKSVI